MKKTGIDLSKDPALRASGPRSVPEFFQRRDLHNLSAVDAKSFAIMRRAGIRLAVAFDHHFAVPSFRMVV